MRRTKIVATIGPASETPDVIAALVEAGTDVFRLNLSHGGVEDHLERLATIRRVASDLGRRVGVLADLPGPKIRSGSFPDGGVDLVPGALVDLVSGDQLSTAAVIEVDYERLIADVAVGDRVMLGDGGITLRVVGMNDLAVRAEVESGGRVQGRPGVHLACEGLTLHSPTADDLVLAETMCTAGVDFVALSFVRRGSDVAMLREVVGKRARIMAKIETASALAELPAICAEADAVMVARGDLGLDCPLEDVPHLQKQIIRTCVASSVPVVTATQMLESMIDAPTPTRAEVSDVANAVFDGTDAVMLSGETAIGHDPALVVRTMSKIAERAEANIDYRLWGQAIGGRRSRVGGDESVSVETVITESIAHAAWQAADDVGAAAIICCTRTGRLVLTMARFRPAARLIAVTPMERTMSALSASWGVESVLIGEVSTTDEMVWLAVERSLHQQLITTGDIVVVIAGAPDVMSGAADVLRIVRVQ